MRNFRVVGLSEEGHVITQRDGAEPRSSGLTATEYAAPEDLEDGMVFDYYGPGEKRILRQGHKLDAKAARRRRREPEPEAEQAPARLQTACTEPLTCRMCKESKPAEEFSLMRTSKTGRRSYCRGCAKSYADARKEKTEVLS